MLGKTYDCFMDFEIHPKMSQEFFIASCCALYDNQVHVFSRKELELNFPYLVSINFISFKCTLISQFIKNFYIFSSLFPFFEDLSIHFLILFCKICIYLLYNDYAKLCQFLK